MPHPTAYFILVISNQCPEEVVRLHVCREDSTVAGFKGLERPAVVLTLDGFHDELDPRGVLYTGMSRARDLLVVVAPGEVLEAAGGTKFHRRLLHHEHELP